MSKLNPDSPSARRVLDMRKGMLIAQLRHRLPRNGRRVRYSGAYFDQLAQCADNEARRLLLGLR